MSKLHRTQKLPPQRRQQWIYHLQKHLQHLRSKQQQPQLTTMSMREQKRTCASHHTSKKAVRASNGVAAMEPISRNRFSRHTTKSFKIPSGKAGKLVVKELTHLFEAYAEATTLESVAITAAMVLPSLILQKPHRSSKKKEHIKCIERRMQLWKDGNLDDLLKEGQTIQQHLHKPTRDQRSEEQLARSFSKLMMEGKV